MQSQICIQLQKQRQKKIYSTSWKIPWTAIVKFIYIDAHILFIKL